MTFWPNEVLRAFFLFVCQKWHCKSIFNNFFATYSHTQKSSTKFYEDNCVNRACGYWSGIFMTDFLWLQNVSQYSLSSLPRQHFSYNQRLSHFRHHKLDISRVGSVCMNELSWLGTRLMPVAVVYAGISVVFETRPPTSSWTVVKLSVSLREWGASLWWNSRCEETSIFSRRWRNFVNKKKKLLDWIAIEEVRSLQIYIFYFIVLFCILLYCTSFCYLFYFYFKQNKVKRRRLFLTYLFL